jgi:hypothetical protein
VRLRELKVLHGNAARVVLAAAGWLLLFCLFVCFDMLFEKKNGFFESNRPSFGGWETWSPKTKISRRMSWFVDNKIWSINDEQATIGRGMAGLILSSTYVFFPPLLRIASSRITLRMANSQHRPVWFWSVYGSTDQKKKKKIIIIINK